MLYLQQGWTPPILIQSRKDVWFPLMFIKTLRGLTNVAHAGDDLTFNNDKTANGLGSAFFGRVDTEGNITMDISFSEIDEISWNMVLVSYHFEGKKQIE